MKSRVIKKGKYLYFTTEEKIEKGDQVMSLERETEWHRESEMVPYRAEYMDQIHPDDRKIVASNDTATKLPEPPKEFIDIYYEVGGIDEVEIEYYKYAEELSGVSLIPRDLYRIKIDSNNCITIRPFKDSWSKEEVIELIESAVHDFSGMNTYDDDNLTRWIKENLYEKNNNT